MQRNPTNATSSNSNTKLFEDAAKKLQKIEKDRKMSEKYFKERENAENKLKLLESNLKKKVKLEKRASLGLEEKTVDKIQMLLKSLSNVDMNLINKIEDNCAEKSSKSIQTDQEDTQVLKDKFTNLEKENEKNSAKKKERKKNIEILKSEIEQLKAFNDKLNKENKLLQQNLEEMSNNKNEISNRLKEIIKQNEILSESLKKNNSSLKDYDELKKIMEEKLIIEKESLEIEEHRRENAQNNYKGNLKVLVYFDLIENLTQFLPPNDINNLKLTSKVFFSTINNNLDCTKNYYRNIIICYRKKLLELSSIDLRKEYLVNDTEIERLIKDYVKSNKLPGKELKTSIVRALGFMNKDVKTALGIKVNQMSNTPKSNNSGSTNSTQGGAGILGGIGSLFGGMFHKTQNTPMPVENKRPMMSQGSDTPKGYSSVQSSESKVSSRGMSIVHTNETPIEIDKYDKFLIHENIGSEILDFDYNSVDEIKNLLNRFLKSNFSTEKLTTFIREVCQEYSELLFYANKSVNEIRELEIVKNALNERYRRYYKLALVLESEFSEFKKTMCNNNQNEDAKSRENNQKLETKYNAARNEIALLREQVETNQKKAEMLRFKEQQIVSEYESFKVIFLKELRNVKYDLEETTKQRNTIRDVLIEFKSYFNLILNAQIK